MENNPELIQMEDWSSPTEAARSTPLFMIHDGGGTTFAYHLLDSLARTVYGIHNPNFRNGERFDGGIVEMATLYCDIIRKKIQEPDYPKKRGAGGAANILLGGWSLGGLLSLEVARQLAEDRRVRVVGIVMIDSICPIITGVTAPVNRNMAAVQAKRHKNQILSEHAMSEARRMLEEWELPQWEGPLAGKRPKTVLVRARDFVPINGDMHMVDVHRAEKKLGWDRYDKKMFAAVVEVEGNHFSILDLELVKRTTLSIRNSLQRLDSLAKFAY